MAARNDAATESAELVLILERIFDAPRNLVFKVWSEPQHLAHWWGPKGFTLPVYSMDFRPGGAYRFCMRSPEGVDHWLRGVYREILESERLAFTYAWEDSQGRPGHETLVTVTFTEQGGKTKLTLHQAIFTSITARDAHQRGWTENLARLADHLDKV